MDTLPPDPHAMRSAGRRILHDDAMEARVVEGMSAEEWIEAPTTQSLARRLGLEEAVRHVAALVWSGWIGA
ncbi:MAG: hypothetical protein U0230_26015 [Polyangiales bacterium]